VEVRGVLVEAAIGPLDWESYAAPKLEAVDTEGKHLRLEGYRGQTEQLVSMNSHAADWANERTVVLAVSSVSSEKNKNSQKLGKLGFRLLSDPDHENARRFASYDDFEELELHSTILIDAQGRVHWKRTGGDPFVDMDFLLKALKKLNAKPAATVTYER